MIGKRGGEGGGIRQENQVQEIDFWLAPISAAVVLIHLTHLTPTTTVSDIFFTPISGLPPFVLVP